MPDMMTHIFMGHDVLNGLPEKNIFKKAAMQNIGLFNDGLMGPDPFFYNGIFPWDRYSLSHIGHLMHREKTGTFLLSLIGSLDTTEECLDKRTSYLAGLICHYVLDTTAHPYIYYFSGVNSTGDDPKYDVCHKRLEIILDMLLIRQRFKEPVHRIEKSSLLDTSDETLCAFKDASKNLRMLYGKPVPPEEFLQSLRYMQKAIWALRDPYGLKKPLFALLDRVLKTNGLYAASVYDSRKIKSLDYGNRQREIWLEPSTGEPRSESFFDLYETAVGSARKKISMAHEYLMEHAGKEDLSVLFPDISYNTGRTGEEAMIHHRCLFD